MRWASTVRIAAASAMCMVSFACSSNESMPRVAAVVQGVELPAAEVEAMTARYQSIGVVDAEHPLIPDDEARLIIVDFLIRTTLLKTIATDLGVEPVPVEAIDAAIAALGPEELAQASLQPEDLRASIEAGELSRRVAERQFPNVAVSDFEVSELYEKVKDRYAAGWSAQVRVAFFTDEGVATSFTSGDSDATTFDAKATEMGAGRVGSMGTVSNVDALGQQVIDTLGALPAGRLSDPVPATGGWLVFLVESRVDVPATTLEGARTELTEQLEDQKRQKLFEDWFEERLSTATITVDKFYGRWSSERKSVR